MKKLLLVIPIIMLTGCATKEQLFEQYAETYYENHMKMVNNVNQVVVTLEDIQNASAEDEYDMRRLNKCQKTSKVTLNIDKTTKEITSKKVELKCK
jgi:uncharacterized lipoprotein YajG